MRWVSPISVFNCSVFLEFFFFFPDFSFGSLEILISGIFFSFPDFSFGSLEILISGNFFFFFSRF